MNSVWVGVSIALFMVGGILGFVPLSVLNTVSFSTPNISSASNGATTVSFTITNNNASTNFVVYMKVTNAAYQSIWLNTMQVTSSSSTANVNQLSIGTLSPGAYIFNVFAVSVYGVALSGTTSQAFNVGGNYQLYIDAYNPAIGSITPSCSQSNPCSYPVGQSVSVTYSPSTGYVFGDWCYWGSGSSLPANQGCTALNPNGAGVSTANPLVLTMNQNYEVVVGISQTSPILNIQYFTVTPTVSITGGCPIMPPPYTCGRGSVAPTGTTKIYSLASSSSGQTSQIFTASPSANFTFTNFQVNGKNFTQNPVTLNYTALKAVQTVSGQLDFQLYAYFKAKQFYQLGVGTYSGITTTPAAKNGATYYYPTGASVTVSIANVASNVCFTGWLVDGNGAGTANSVTVTMNSYHHVFAQGVGKPSTGCGPPPPPCPNCPTTTANPLLAIPFFGAGAITLAIGLRKRR